MRREKHGNILEKRKINAKKKYINKKINKFTYIN
jgi:hypothetical protein